MKMKKWQQWSISAGLILSSQVFAQSLPAGFVYLDQVDPTIQQSIRYASSHNFVGRPIKGYEKSQCILTQSAAQALKNVQHDLKLMGYSLKVYDCYRPQMAVEDFYNWSLQPQATQMQGEFYPRTHKDQLFADGYIARQSGHSRGSTMDLTIVPLPLTQEPPYQPGQKLVACYAPYKKRYQDNSIDMGTGYDCLDITAHVNNQYITSKEYQNRLLLRNNMIKEGFTPYEKEWWHFTLKNEPYPNHAFNFPVN